MASNRTMSTEEIKRGLENIKKAQLEVLKELRGDSFSAEAKQTQLKGKNTQLQAISNIRYQSTYELDQPSTRNDNNQQTTENRQNIQLNGNKFNKSPIATKNDKTFQNKLHDTFSNPKYPESNPNYPDSNTKSLEPTNKYPESNSKSVESNHKSIRTTESSTALNGSSAEGYDALRREFSLEREELKKKLNEITAKLNELQKDSSEGKTNSRIIQEAQHAKQLKHLQTQNKHFQQQNKQFQQQKKNFQQQNKNFQQQITSLTQQNSDLLQSQKKLKSQLQLNLSQKTILETEMKSLKAETIKQARAIKDLETQITKHMNFVKEIKQSAVKGQQSRINMDVVMKEVRQISMSHQFMFNKLKESTTLDMTLVERESEIQNSFSRLLEYFETLSSSSSGYLSVNHEDEGYTNGNHYMNGNQYANSHQSMTKNVKRSVNQSKQMIKRSVISESRVQEEEELSYLVREMGGLSKKQLMEENEILRRRVGELGQGLSNYNRPGSSQRPATQSQRLISLQLEQMREQVGRFKKLKQQIRQEQEELQQQTLKYRVKAKQLQAKLQTSDRKLSELTHIKYGLQNKCQQQSIQILSLNSIIKELNAKLTSNIQTDSPLTQLRNQFSKLLETNSLLQRQNNSLKAMNEGLQAQIQTINFQKDQFQTNNLQKHQLIQHQIQERKHLLNQIQQNSLKHTSLKQQHDKLKNTLLLHEEQTLKTKKHHEDLLQQKNQQVLALRKQIQDLYKQSREYHQLRFAFDKLQKEHKELARKSLQMGETLTHLWSVKQAEYHNVNQLLGLLKTGDPYHDQQQSAHF